MAPTTCLFVLIPKNIARLTFILTSFFPPSWSPLKAAANLRAKLLIIHGTSEDNVHLQNTINFLNALIRAGKPYEFHLQPGQKHGFQGNIPRTYVDQRILDFLKQGL